MEEKDLLPVPTTDLLSTQSLIKASDVTGEKLIDAAVESFREDWKNRVVGEVKRLLGCREDSLSRIEFFTRSANWYERKLNAINGAKFKFTREGQMIFEDEDLNRANY
jgi:hypothetical protein